MSENHLQPMSKSRQYFERARRVMPAGLSNAIRDVAPIPFYVDRASGARLYDVDGNVWTDYWSGHGALILGHAPARVVAAVRRQLDRGTHFGFSHPLEVELAELVAATMPGAEMVRFTNSGTEANMYAIGLARCFTGRMKIAKIEGGWHGGYEPLMKAVHAPYTDAESAGLNPKSLQDTIVVPFNDLEAARRAISAGDLACLVVEPMLGAAGFITPVPGYLEGLRQLCDGHGTLLVFDEVVSGFRLAPGGAQELYGVTPDITVAGKIIGGGFPIGALCGRREVFERLDHRLFENRCHRAFHGGTFTGNPISMTAGIETLKMLSDGTVYRDLARLGDEARNGLERIFSSAGIDAAVTGVASTFGIHFRKGVPVDAREAAASDGAMARRYFEHMLDRRIAYLTPAVPHMFLNAAHTSDDISRLLAATEEFAKAL
jgi:glutamate-1-semialdehyde 2,1-aminomutase